MAFQSSRVNIKIPIFSNLVESIFFLFFPPILKTSCSLYLHIISERDQQLTWGSNKILHLSLRQFMVDMNLDYRMKSPFNLFVRYRATLTTQWDLSIPFTLNNKQKHIQEEYVSYPVSYGKN